MALPPPEGEPPRHRRRNGPTDPIDPVGPTDPAGPTDPVGPIDSVGSTDPVGSTGLRRRLVTVVPERPLPYEEADWRDALVVVGRGGIVLEGVSGRREAFAPGAVLWLEGVPLRALRAVGPGPAVLVVTWRCIQPRG
jgi:hypothetical protein